MKVSSIALAVTLALGAVPAIAQTAAPMQPRVLNLTGAERRALSALQTAAAGQDRAAQDAALAAARSAAQGADARYALGNLQFQIGRARGDANMQTQAIDALVASGVPQGAELAPLLSAQAARAYSANDLHGADRLLTRAVELQPNNAAIVADYAQYKARLGDRPAAVAQFQRAIELQRAAGQPVPEAWYRRALAIAFDGRLAPQGIIFAQGLAAAYPSPLNWRDALLAYIQLGAPDPALDLDIRRLQRASGGLTGERDYVEFARTLNTAGASAEAKSVLDEGVERAMILPSEAAVAALIRQVNPRAATQRAGLAAARTRALAAAEGAAALAAGDAQYGAGNFAEAAELYAAALQKGGQDANLVNCRLGAALARAGRRPEAETALRTVTGARAGLAGFWLAWLSRPTA